MPTSDLSVLRRPQRAERPTDASKPVTGVDPPARRWKTRVLVPASILAAALGILAFAARDALRPAVAVEIVPTIARTGTASAGTAVVQAPGWVEPDPFFVSVTSLTDGIVEDVVVLEGDAVSKGQLIARLVPDDARLALQRAEAELGAHQAQLRTAEAVAREA